MDNESEKAALEALSDNGPAKVYAMGWQARDEQLRELLSYCRAEAETLDLDNLSDEFNPYDDIAYRLGQILDGEQ